MVIMNSPRGKRATKHERSRMDDARAQMNLTYLDSLKLASRILNRTILAYNDICSTEVKEVIREFRRTQQFTFQSGRRIML